MVRAAERSKQRQAISKGEELWVGEAEREKENKYKLSQAIQMKHHKLSK